MTERISTERLREIVDAIDYGEDTGSTSMRKDQREACRELLALRELPEEMESAEEFVRSIHYACGVPQSAVREINQRGIEETAARDAQHARDRLALEDRIKALTAEANKIASERGEHFRRAEAMRSERDSAQEEHEKEIDALNEEVANNKFRVARLVPLEEENKRLREALFEIETTSGTYAEEASDMYFNQLTDIEAHAHAALNPPAAATALEPTK